MKQTCHQNVTADVPKMKRRGGQKMQHRLRNTFKTAPKWLPGGLWAALGPDPAARRSPEPSRRGSGHGPKKFILAALERPWSEKWIDFGLLEGPREGPGGGLGGHLGSFLAVGPAGTKKKAEK